MKRNMSRKSSAGKACTFAFALLVAAGLCQSAHIGPSAGDAFAAQSDTSAALVAATVPDDADGDAATIIVQLREGSTLGLSAQSDEAERRHRDVQERIEALARDAVASGEVGAVLGAQSDDEGASDTRAFSVLHDYYHAIDGFAVRAPREILPEVTALPEVKCAFVARELEVPQDEGTLDDASPSNGDALAMTGADSAGVRGDGQVIAVIDSGLDVDHEAFSGNLDDSAVAWSKADVRERKSACMQGGKGARYVSEKIVFAYDYGNDDDDVVPYNSGLSHGTHVTAIAAANAGKVRGTAPNAQIVAMKVANDVSGGIPEAGLIAALDDVVVLAPDVVNMSLGTTAGFSEEESQVYADIFSTLRDTGCTLCVSAGNNASSVYRGQLFDDKPYATDPDVGTVSSPASYPFPIAVASADVSTSTPCFTAADGTAIAYVDAYFTMGATGAGFDQVADGTYRYVDAGDGSSKTVEALKEAHPEGFADAVVLVENGTFDDEGNILMSGARAGNVSDVLNPAATIIYASEEGELTSFNAGMATKTPAVCITKSSADLLLAAQDALITVSHGSVVAASTDYRMSYFSSWGTTPEMTLKPEVTAPGGDVYSAVLKGEYDYKSGTSMAAPHLAGIAALVRERIEKDAEFGTLTADERQGAVSQLVMSTAHPLRDAEGSGDWYSPRRQGAGIANVPAALVCDVLVSVEGAADASKPKAELGSSEQGLWSFTVNLRNLGRQERVFAPSTVALSETIADGRFQLSSKDYVGHGITVSYGGAFDQASGTVSVPAGQTASLDVEIRCDDEFAAAVAQAVNGTFVDGFAMLRACDEGGVDLSVPFVAYYGNWSKAPLFDAKADSGQAPHVSASYLSNAENGAVTGANPLDDEALDAFSAGDYSALDQSLTVVSASSEAKAVRELLPRTGLLRNARSLSYEYVDAEGATVSSFDYGFVAKSVFSDAGWSSAEKHLSSQPSFTGIDESGRQLPDGRYTLRVTGVAAGAQEGAQVLEYGFSYDTTPPTIEAFDLTGEGDGARFTLRASDASPIAGIGFLDAETGEAFHTVLGSLDDAAVDGQGVYANTFDVAAADVQAAWESAGHDGDLPADVQACVWDFGMNRASTGGSDAGGFSIEDGTLTSYTGASTVAVVPEGVTEIADGAFRGSAVTAVVIPASVRSIGARAFYGVESLRSLAFVDTDEQPSSLEDIGAEAFAKTSVGKVVLPRSLKEIGSGAFADSKVAEAFIPAGVAEVPAAAFARSELRRVVLSPGVRSIGSEAFADCAYLESVETGSALDDARDGMPETLAAIGERAFANAGIGKLALGESVESIGAAAFSGSSIASLDLPDSVAHLGAEALGSMKRLARVSIGANVPAADLEGVFAGSVELRRISVSADNAQCTDVDGVVFGKDGKRLIAYPVGAGVAYEVPAGVERIGRRAFEGATLYGVTLPESLTAIEDAAFKGSNVEGALVLPKSLETVGESAFAGCAISSLDVGGAKSLGANSFADCAELRVLDMRCDLGRLESVGDGAFGSGTPLGSVVMPDSLAQVGTGAFSNNDSLREVHVGAAVTESYSALFAGCDNVEKLTVSERNAAYYAESNVLYSRGADGMHVVLSLPTNAYASYEVAAGTVQIDKAAFKNNVKLETLVLPEGLKVIESGAFNGCSALANVTFPDSLEVVSGFYNTAIDLAEFGGNIVSIGKNAFSGHNPAHLVVRGGKQGFYESSSERGEDKRPVKTAYFGEGMVKADFSANKIAPPEILVVPSTMTTLKFAPASSKVDYDPASVMVYAPRGSSGWQAASNALAAIGADASTQLLEYEPLSCTVSASASAGASTSVRAQAAGGVVGAGGYEFRFVEVGPAKRTDGTLSERVVRPWGPSASFDWQASSGASLRCDVRDATFFRVSRTCTVPDKAQGGSADAAKQDAADEKAAANQKLSGKAQVKKTYGAKPFALGVKSSYKGAVLSYAVSNKKVVSVSKSGKVSVRAPGTAKVTVTAKAKAKSGKTYTKRFKVTVKVALAKAALTAKTKSVKRGKVKAAWKRVAGAQGYQLKVGKKTCNVKGGKKLKKVVKAAAGKKVKVRVRAWSAASGAKVYGPWSKARTVRM